MGVRSEGWLRWSFVQGVCAVPCFCSQHTVCAPALQKWQLGFLVFLNLLSRMCSNFTCTQLSLIVSLYLAAIQERFVQVQALQQRVPDPSLSQDDRKSRLINSSQTSHHLPMPLNLGLPTPGLNPEGDE